MERITELFATELSAVSVPHLLLCVGLSFALSLYIILVYRLVYSGVLYSRRFALSLMILSLVTSVVILAISSNVVLSLGMVGALSIVRFRTAVKDFMDTVFMFWAIVNGIICGAGFVLISVIASLAVGALILAVYYLGGVAQRDLYLVVVRTKDDVPFAGLSPLLDKAEIKSCSSAGGLQETIVETRLNSKQLTALRSLTDKAGVISVDIVAYNTKTGL
jgi:hypothetical protein